MSRSLALDQTAVHYGACWVRLQQQVASAVWARDERKTETAPTGGQVPSCIFYIKVDPPHTGANTALSRPRLCGPTGDRKPSSKHSKGSSQVLAQVVIE